MALRIPLSPDQTLQTEFHEVERRLRALEKRTGVTVGSSIRVVNTTSGAGVPINLQPFLDRLTALEQQVNNLPTPVTSNFGGVGATSAAGLVPAPGVPEPPTGVAGHVLLSDGTWGFPFRGLVQVATSGEQTAPPYDVIDIGGAVHAHGIVASSVECNDLRVYGNLYSQEILTRGGSLLAAAGLTAGINAVVWYATFPCRVLSVLGYRVGGTGATINARLNGGSDHLASDLSLTAADTWIDGGAVQNVTYATGDKLEIMVVSVAGLPTQVAVQVDLQRV